MTAPYFPKDVLIGGYTDWQIVQGYVAGSLGTGFNIGDTYTFTGGTHLGAGTVFTVATVDGSHGITSYSSVQDYYGSPLPTLPNTFTVLTGGGSGATAASFLLGHPLDIYVASPTSGGGMGGLVTNLTVSAWLCLNLNEPISISALPQTGDVVHGLEITTTFLSQSGDTLDVQVDVNLNATPGVPATVLFNGSWTGSISRARITVAGTLYLSTAINLQISFDAGSQGMVVYANDTALTLTSGGWSSSGSMINTSTNWVVYQGHNTIWGGEAANIGALWILNQTLDLTSTTIRRNWINADLSSAVLPSNGQISTGAVPIVWLNTTTTAAAFLTNGGSGGNWHVYVESDGNLPATLPAPTTIPLELPVNATCTSSFVVGFTQLSMDNVIVQSLATESPCTAIQFSPAATTTPSFGLRWSDTRGATWGNPVPQEFSSDPYSQPQWNRLGLARDRVFELFWSAAYKTAVNGAFVEVFPLKT